MYPRSPAFGMASAALLPRLRYGNILFDIRYELLQTGKRERPSKTLKKGVKVRIKNKSSQFHKRGRKRPKYKSPCPEHPQTIQNMDYLKSIAAFSWKMIETITGLHHPVESPFPEKVPVV